MEGRGRQRERGGGDLLGYLATTVNVSSSSQWWMVSTGSVTMSEIFLLIVVVIVSVSWRWFRPQTRVSE